MYLFLSFEYVFVIKMVFLTTDKKQTISINCKFMLNLQ